MSFEQIGQKLRLNASTCFSALKRYKANGFKYINHRKANWTKAWTTNEKIKGDVKSYLLSHDTLSKWAGYSLKRRCQMLHQEKGLKVKADTLSKFYRKNRVKYVVVKYQY